MTNSKKFDLVNALIADGFKETAKSSLGGYSKVEYTKKFSQMVEVAWHGQQERTFTVVVNVIYDHKQNPINVEASYSNGKIKQHAYGKRAYNAIADTVKNNCFEMEYME